MSLECENWSDARSKTAQRIYEELRSRPHDASSAAHNELPSAARKRKREPESSARHTGLQTTLHGSDGFAPSPSSQLESGVRIPKHAVVVDLTEDDPPETTDMPYKQKTPRRQLPCDSSTSTGALGDDSAATGTRHSPIPVSVRSSQYKMEPVAAIARTQVKAPPKLPKTDPPTVYYAVRVGWFPGIYTTAAEVTQQTKHYPRNESSQFPTLQQAHQFLAAPSRKVDADAKTRPRIISDIDRAGFLDFSTRTWLKKNKHAEISTREVAEKLQFLFRQACDATDEEVVWKEQALPQVLIQWEWERAAKDGVLEPLGLCMEALRPRGAMGVPASVKRESLTSAEPGGLADCANAASMSGAVKMKSAVKTESAITTECTVKTERATHVPSLRVKQEVAAIPSPSSSSQNHFPVSPCSCGKPTPDSEVNVTCANETCKTGTFHKACVGLASRKDNSNWRCWQCRPKAPATLSSSQGPSSSQPTSAQLIRQPPPVFQAVVQTHVPTPAGRPEAEPALHPEQARVVESILSGQNVFYTGSAGTGKSTILKAFVSRMKKEGKQVDIVAPSGIAALNVGGKTTYAYAGWHPDRFKDPLVDIIKSGRGKKVQHRLSQTDVLVIDEISMVERDVLHRLDVLMREAREGHRPEHGKKRLSYHSGLRPFGGVQIVVTGDFCQLPPVKPFRYCLYCGGDELEGYSRQETVMKCKRCKRTFEERDKWAFKADVWKACEFKCFELRHIHRQSDEKFIEILQRCRFGKPLLPKHKELLLNCQQDLPGAVKLMPLRNEVDTENRQNFNSLQTPQLSYDCLDFFIWRNKMEPDLQKFGNLRYSERGEGSPLAALKDHRFEETVKLKVGMLVILLVNLDFTIGLVNGSQGRIVGFEAHDESKVFPPQVAPSSPSKKRSRLTADDKISEYAAIREEQTRAFIARVEHKQWPIVSFTNGVVQAIYPSCQMGEQGSEKPYSYLGRTQMPLLAAWAITVHKSQGMTLSRVIVDLYRSFEREMVYVALSRARSLEGLKVVRLARGMEEGTGGNREVQAFLRECGFVSAGG